MNAAFHSIPDYGCYIYQDVLQQWILNIFWNAFSNKWGTTRASAISERPPSLWLLSLLECTEEWILCFPFLFHLFLVGASTSITTFLYQLQGQYFLHQLRALTSSHSSYASLFCQTSSPYFILSIKPTSLTSSPVTATVPVNAKRSCWTWIRSLFSFNIFLTLYNLK